jgi:hypothetical protein
MSILQVLYSCKGCSLTDVPVTVAHRKQGEDVVKWMRQVQIRLYDDHASRSPRCKSLVDAKIPIQADKGIGMVP